MLTAAGVGSRHGKFFLSRVVGIIVQLLELRRRSSREGPTHSTTAPAPVADFSSSG